MEGVLETCSCFCEFFLKVFYDATLSFSVSLHVIANNFFERFVSIEKSLNKWMRDDDPMIQKMETNMQLKFNKYSESCEINYLLFVVVFLDTRYKFE